MEPLTLPGLEEESEAGPETVGLGGKTSVVASHPALLDLIRKGGMWVTIVLGFGLLVIVAVAMWPRAPSAPSDTLAPIGTQPNSPSLSTDSLGFRFPDLTARWNEVDAPPSITKGIPRTPEIGAYDGFTYRFNQSSLLAGVYDDRTEEVYALLASSWISDENAHRLVIHLCHLAHPYDQACLDAYFEDGLGGKTLEDFRDMEHRAEWRLGEVTWRLEIVDNIQSLRVIAPGAEA